MERNFRKETSNVASGLRFFAYLNLIFGIIFAIIYMIASFKFVLPRYSYYNYELSTLYFILFSIVPTMIILIGAYFTFILFKMFAVNVENLDRTEDVMNLEILNTNINKLNSNVEKLVNRNMSTKDIDQIERDAYGR